MTPASVSPRLALAAFVTIAASSTFLWAQQFQATPRPEAATGAVRILGEVQVGGDVNVANSPTVKAEQAGPWTVQLGLGAKVAIATPAFLQTNTPYEITWPDGGVEVIRITELRENGWVVVDRGRGWFNLAQARSIRTYEHRR